jgi:hypothetical protein
MHGKYVGKYIGKYIGKNEAHTATCGDPRKPQRLPGTATRTLL